MSSSKKTDKEKEQEERDQKCCTTRYWIIGVVCLFLCIVMFITAAAIYGEEQLALYETSDFDDNCFIQSVGIGICDTTGGDSKTEVVYILVLRQDNRHNGTVIPFKNKCPSLQFESACEKQTPYEVGDVVGCWAYSNDDCKDSRIDNHDDWAQLYTNYVIVLIIAIVLLVIGVILLLISIIQGRKYGCFCCFNYDQCCWAGDQPGKVETATEQEIQEARRGKKAGTRSNANKNQSASEEDGDGDENETTVR